MDLNTLAARRVRAGSTGPADELELLEMLGLVTPDLDWSDDSPPLNAGLPRDPSKVNGMGPLSGGQPVITPTHEWLLDRPRVSTAPEGLRNLPPVKPVVRVVKPKLRDPGNTGACGEPRGYRRHRRAGEDACRACKDAHNEERNAGAARRRAA